LVRFTRERDSSVDKLAVSATALLVLCALVLLIFSRSITFLTGRTASAAVAAPDALAPSAGDDATPFLLQRNMIEITVPEEMAVRDLLDLYRLNKPDQTRQVFEQLPKSATPSTLVKPGTRLKIALTPTDKDIPEAPQERPR
jgi:hypothetical protein